MSRVCELTGKGVLFGNNVSHSERKTRRKYKPNLQQVTFDSDVLGIKIRCKSSTNGISTVLKHGGLDQYLATAKNTLLSSRVIKIKKSILAKLQLKAELLDNAATSI